MSLIETDKELNAEAQQEAAQERLRDRVRARWAKMIAFVSIIAIALGGLNIGIYTN